MIMGDMKDDFKAFKDIKKQQREARAAKYEPLLEADGAHKVANGVWILGTYVCYPTKGFALHKTTRKRVGLDKLLKIKD